MMLTQLMGRLTTVPLVGIDVGTAVTKVVEVVRTAEQVILRRAGLAPTQPAPAGDAAPEPQAKRLTQLLEASGITRRTAALGLASPEAIVRPFQVPRMPRKELRSAIRLEAEAAILNGHTLDEIAIDWHILSADTHHMRGVLGVVPKTHVEAHLRMATEAGVRPLVMDVQGLALWNAYWVLAGSRRTTRPTVLLLNIGAQTTNLVIARGPDELVLVRDLQLGAEAIARQRVWEWIVEIKDSLGYARACGGLRALDEALMVGGGADPQTASVLETALEVPVERWDPLHDIARDPQLRSLEDSSGPLLAIAIGLALRQPG